MKDIALIILTVRVRRAANIWTGGDSIFATWIMDKREKCASEGPVERSTTKCKMQRIFPDL